MSRYRRSGDFAYRDPPPPPRWDADRFMHERDHRQVDDHYAPVASPPPPRRAARPVYEDERFFYEDDRYGPGGARFDRRYFEEDEYYDPRLARGQMIPYRSARPPRPDLPPRPGLLRRQSSLDTFDRAPARRYDDHDGYRPPVRPPRINIDVPDPPSPRSNRYRPAHPPRPAYDYYDERDYSYYDDVAVQDPDYYGDDGFREYREREWVHRSRDDSGSRSRSRPPVQAKEEKKEEVKEEKKEVVRKEEIKEEVKEKPYPRRGKTKMPKRLVHTKVLHDLGYSFYEEGEKTIIIEKALGPDNIDEVFAKSREYREKEVSNTRLIEAPAPPSATSAAPPPSVRAPSAKAPSVAAPSVHESFKEEDFRETEIRTKPLSEAPRSVREWDQLNVKADIKEEVKSARAPRSTARSKSRRRSTSREKETVIEKRSTVIEREPSRSRSRSRSPARRRRHKSRSRHRRARSDVSETEFYERKIIREEDDFIPVESDSVHVGPLVLARDLEKESRSARDLRAKIRQLEAEQRALRRERFDREEDDIVKVEHIRPSRSRSRTRVRRFSDDEDIVKIERRVPDRSPSPLGKEVIIERRGDEIVEVRKDRRERSFSRTRAPSAGLIKSMFYTLT